MLYLKQTYQVKFCVGYKFNMKFLLSSYKTSNSFSYYIDLAYSSVIIVVKFRFFLFKLPPIFFYKLGASGYKFLFFQKSFYTSFLKHFFSFYNKCFTFFYFRLQLKGLGYRVFNVAKNLLKIYFNRSNFFYVHIPLCILLKNRTRRLFFISTKGDALSVFIIGILYLKEFVIYRQHGLYYPRQILLIKPGKNKFR
jgi:hypothetical protein